MDRNLLLKITITVDDGSLSARRAWIEMSYLSMAALCQVVALRKESVDRNVLLVNGGALSSCRSPQGERG